MITQFPFGRVAICKESIVFSIYLVYLWNLCLCRVKPLLPEKVMLQKSQGIDNPSMWLASMWDFISHESPSFPHTLQMYDLCCLGIPLGFLPFGITFSSSTTLPPDQVLAGQLLNGLVLLMLWISCLGHFLLDSVGRLLMSQTIPCELVDWLIFPVLRSNHLWFAQSDPSA